MCCARSTVEPICPLRLLSAQRLHRIDLRRAPRGRVAGECRDHGDQRHPGGDRERVIRGQPVQDGVLRQYSDGRQNPAPTRGLRAPNGDVFGSPTTS
jgi:hypothetical protein